MKNSPVVPLGNGEKLLKSFYSRYFDKSVAFSQPYYSNHTRFNLERGEVKPFLQEYYYLPAAIAERDTFTFWEYMIQLSNCVHKTHEEG